MDMRKKQILDVLSDGEYYTAEYLAERLQSGTRTVRNLLKEVNQEIETYGALILSKYGAGYYLHITDRTRFDSFVRKLYSHLSDKYLPETSEERIQYLLEYLFSSPSYVKLDELSESLYISKRTLTADLKKVEKYINRFHLSLIRKPNHGIKLEGSEFNIRLCIASFSGKRLHKGNQSMDEIAECVSDILKKNELLITGAAYQNLVVHLYIAISRIMECHYVPISGEAMENMVGRFEYQTAKEIVRKIEAVFCISFPDTEINYVAIHLAGKKMIYHTNESKQNVIITQEIDDLVTVMLERVYDLFKFDFRSDLELRMLLCLHLLPLTMRLKHGMVLKNPLLRDVKEKFCLSYTMACNAATVINEHFLVCLSEDEIAYFAFAFALALERRKAAVRKKNILLVCASGLGSAKLLQYKYQELFKDYINKLTACDAGSVHKVDFSTYDYIFTTVPISVHVPLPIMEVGYFLNDKDVINVKNFLKGSQTAFAGKYYEREMFLPHLKLRTKEEVLRCMCQFVMEKKKLPREFYESVLKRERLARTAFGNMAAMPHVYKAVSEETFACVGILDEPVDWEGEEVRAVFLVSVADNGDDLQLFYQMTATFLLDRNQIKNLIQKQDYDSFIEAMGGIEARISEER